MLDPGAPFDCSGSKACRKASLEAPRAFIRNQTYGDCTNQVCAHVGTTYTVVTQTASKPPAGKAFIHCNRAATIRYLNIRKRDPASWFPLDKIIRESAKCQLR